MPESKRLGSYLTAAVTLGTLASSAEAAIVQLDVSSISGPNGGVAEGPNGVAYVPLQTLSAGAPYGVMGLFNVYNPAESQRIFGIANAAAMEFAVVGMIEPRNFLGSADISAAAFTGAHPLFSLFYMSGTSNGGPVVFRSPDFGPDSYMGFRVAENMVPNPIFGLDPGDPNYDVNAPEFIPNGNYYYGWLEVTWKSADSTFEILSGAYESDLNAPILAGAAPGGVSGVPEPTNSLCTLGLLVSGIMIRRRGKKAA